MGRKRVYTDEERKERQRQRCRQYNQEHKAELAKKQKQWYQEHPEYNKQYYQTNRERFKEQRKQYYQDNAERYKEYQKQYCKTPMGRASYLLRGYNREDKKYNRGEGDLTAEWIVENIFPKPCAHCGKEGWKVIGCNRLDNNKPHSKDNVEPCCFKCNSTLPRKIKL